MKRTHTPLFLCLMMLIILSDAHAGGRTLLPALDHGRYGFIDQTGRMVIAPRFFRVGVFSEGLAPAREKGRYGYIDTTGAFVIAPIYDIAGSFSEGIAIVYEQGKPYFIDRSGRKFLQGAYRSFTPFSKGRSIVQVGEQYRKDYHLVDSTGKTIDEKRDYGVIDKEGKLIIDTIYKNISQLDNGNFILSKANYFKDRSGSASVALADSNGKLICPFGVYDDMTYVDTNYFFISIPARPEDTIEGYSVRRGFADRNGRLIYSLDEKKNQIKGAPVDGMALINLNWTSSENGYYGYIDTSGKVLLSSHDYKSAYSFSCGRAVMETERFKTYVIDKKGKKVAGPYDRVEDDKFTNGYALVSVGDNYGVIDTNGHYILPPLYQYVSAAAMDSGLLFFNNIPYDPNNRKELWGIVDLHGKVILPEMISSYSSAGFVDGLLYCIIDDKPSYINMSGQIIWQPSDTSKPAFEPINTEMMMRGHYYAYSSTDERMGFGGWAVSHNIPATISQNLNFAPGKLSLSVRPEMTDTFRGACRGMKTFIANTTKDTIYFNAEDSRLYMKVQALAEDSTWQDIEYLPSSWCGNSYHVLMLEPGAYWFFVTPQYEGDYKTKLRVELAYIDPATDPYITTRPLFIYSNEFDGSINPGQFWLKGRYTPGGIMDPYYD